MKKRLLSALLMICMLLTMLPVTAFAAEPRDAEQYVTATFSDNSGGRDVTVKVVGPNGEDFGTHTYNDVGGLTNTITLTLTDTADGQYDIESVENDSQSGNRHSITSETLSSNSYSCLYSSRNDLTLTVFLVPNYTAPELPNGTIDNGTLSRVYRLYDDQILKMLHAKDIEVSVETKIESVKPTWVNSFSGDDIAFSDIDLTDTDYWNLTVTGTSSDDVQPNNIRKLTITYDNGNGEKTVDIYSGDLSYPIGTGDAGVTQHYNVELRDDSFHIVYFYDTGDLNTTVYSLYDIVFVDDGESLDEKMPKDPYYSQDTTRYEFVCWTETPDGGRPFLETTPVTKDTILYSQKALTTSKSPQIHVMNDDQLLVKELEERFESSFAMESVKITVCGVSGDQTNPDYDIGLYTNGWRENNRYYFVYNYLKGATSAQYNNPVHINDIDKIIVTANDLNGNPLEPVTINKGIYDGEFWVSTGTWDSDMIINLYINDNGVENPENPDPDPEPDPGTGKITGITKTLVKSEADATEAGITAADYTFPENNKVTIPYDGSVTLLYKITVEGEGGAEFTVEDEGATLVNVEGVTVTQDEGDGTFTGTIPDGATSLTFYVSKTFDADDLKVGSSGDGEVLTNTAELTGDNAPDDGEDTAEVDAEEESHPVYVYVKFIGSGADGTLTEEDKQKINNTYGTGLKEDGYMPIGYFEAPMPNPINNESYQHGVDYKETLLDGIKPYISEDTFRWETGVEANAFDLERMNWIKLSIAHGALDFDEELEADCWHLDGQLKLNAPKISVTKALTSIQRGDTTISSTDITDETMLEVDDKLTWTITVTNSGNVAADGLTLTDTLVAVDGEGNSYARTATVTDADGKTVDDSYTFNVAKVDEEGNTITFTATYTVTENDKGLTLSNTAKVEGDGQGEDDDDETENVVANPGVKITKTAKKGDALINEGDKVKVDDTITYEIKVENTGNVDLTDVVIEDSLWEAYDMIKVDGTEYAVADNSTYTIRNPIAAGETVTITYTYTVVEADATEGNITNKVTATVGDEKIGEDEHKVEVEDDTPPTGTLTLTYDANGGSGAPASSSNHSSGETVKLSTEKPTHSDVDNTDVLFIGWTENKTDKIYSRDDDAPETITEVTFENANITVYAAWGYDENDNDTPDVLEKDRITITYHSNFGRDETRTFEYDYGDDFKVRDNMFTRYGYTFTGWNTNRYGTGTDYEPGDTINATGDMTLYAQWRAKDSGGSHGGGSGGSSGGSSGSSHKPDVPDMLNGDDHFAYIIGYEDGTVRPQGSISRAEVATIIFRLLDEDVRERNLTSYNTFDDVAADAWYNTAVSTLADMNIIKGRSATEFDPDAAITRAEFAALFSRFDDSDIDLIGKFSDISSHWAKQEIERAAALGWVNGYEDGTFRPENQITRAEAMTLVNRVLQRLPEDEDDLLDDMRTWTDNRPGAWYYLAVQEATNSHDYDRKSGGYETWTELTEDPDWTQYQ